MKLLRPVLALALAVIAFPRPLPAADLSVTLPDVVEARGGWFYLGEYAELDGERDMADGASMAVIYHDGSFTRGDVIEALSRTAAAGASASIRMPDAVRVLPEPEIVSDLREMTAWKWRIDVDVIPGSWAETLRDYRAYSLPPKIIPGARSLAVKLEDSNGRLHNKQVKLIWYQPMIYSASPIEKNSLLDPRSLRSRIGRAGMTAASFSSPEQLAGASARKYINAGAEIEAGDISQDSFVRAGSTVTMVARVNGLGIEARGVAMQRGGLGDVIRVKNLSSKKVVKARITGPDRVEIDP
ncbi:MAG: flagellar basal body P-ring formation chaperone FlgA [Synergistaceae bacterium]|jgi:flagella basal body P-ring formation protein FlgA|nr:flagellar basal body P-ring formation chaperone FlgA [Synergistaceae bacterium]